MGYAEDFKNKRVLVTGGSRGIGRGIAESLLFYGAEVTVIGKNAENLATFKESHPTLKTICVDLADWEKTSLALTSSGQTFDFLVNNAGICLPQDVMSANPTDFNTTFAINVGSVFSVSQAVAKGMISGGGGIVNISSVASTCVFPHLAIYSASKAALDMVTKVMAVELGPKGIRVNSVNCGGVYTDMIKGVAEIYEKGGWGTDGSEEIKRIPLEGGGMVGMEAVVEAVLFLLSPRTSGATTGQKLFVDGGYVVG